MFIKQGLARNFDRRQKFHFDPIFLVDFVFVKLSKFNRFQFQTIECNITNISFRENYRNNFLHNSKLLHSTCTPNPSILPPSLHHQPARHMDVTLAGRWCVGLPVCSVCTVVYYYNTRRFGALRAPPSSSCRRQGALHALQRGSSASSQSSQ